MEKRASNLVCDVYRQTPYTVYQHSFFYCVRYFILFISSLQANITCQGSKLERPLTWVKYSWQQHGATLHWNTIKVKVKVKERIVLSEIHIRTTGRHLSMGSHSVICHRHRWPPSLHPNRAGWYSIYRPCKNERLSWPSWLVTYRDGLPVHRRSPILVLTGSDVTKLRWSRPAFYH